MLVGRVTGSVVSTNKVEALRGVKLLIVQPVELDTLRMKEDYVICVDDVGAGKATWFFAPTAVPPGSRIHPKSTLRITPCTAIVDSINMRGLRTYDKAKEKTACSWQK